MRAGPRILRVVVFVSHRALTADAPSGVEGEAGAYLYRWFDGRLELVSLLPDDTFVPHAALGYSSPVLTWYPGEFAVSADGSRVFFTDRAFPVDPGRELYLRDDDPRDGQAGVSLHVSASERTDCAGDPTCGGDNAPDPAPDPAPTAAQFQLASSDGTRAFFASPRELTDDATASTEPGFGSLGGNDVCTFFQCDLYRWDSSASAGQRLTDVTPGSPDGASVLATVGASRDASRVYFVASGALAGDAQEGEPNVYLWQEGQGVRFIATLDGSPGPGQVGLAADIGVWSHDLSAGAPNDGSFREARVTADGRYLTFRSRAPIASYDTDGHYQLYRYDAVTSALVCLSCNPRVTASAGDAYLKRHRSSDRRPAWLSRNVTPDGRVVFDSSEGLVSGDSNGKIDVYEWADGAIQLLSSGQDGDGSGFLDASADGRDVFFTTRARLVRSDTDSLVDLYDARIGGGFPEPPPVAPCVGDACQGPPATVPRLGEAATQDVRGAGNAKAPKRQARKQRRCKRGFVKKRIRGKARCVKRKPAGRRPRSGR